MTRRLRPAHGGAIVAIGCFAFALAPGRPDSTPSEPHFVADTVAPSAAWLTLLPAGETKRRFILDCAGCHVFDEGIARTAGAPRTRQGWEEAVRRMLSFAGAQSGFPIISPDRDPVATAAWLDEHLAARAIAPGASGPAVPPGFEVVEYPLPQPDLPHDLAVAPSGEIVVTGMLTNVLYVLDPTTGVFTERAIPVPDANPRAIEIAPDGAWWIVLGGPQGIARYDPALGDGATGPWASMPMRSP